MPFTASTLNLVAQGNGQSVFHYRTADSLATVCAAGYFNSAALQFNLGDEIIVTRTGSNPAAVSLRVRSASATAVAVTQPGMNAESIPITVAAVATTEFTMLLPPCTIFRATTVTTTAFTADTATIQIGTALGGEQIVAATTIKGQNVFAHTVVASGRKFAGGTAFIRVVQTNPAAVGLSVLSLEYVAD